MPREYPSTLQESWWRLSGSAARTAQTASTFRAAPMGIPGRSATVATQKQQQQVSVEKDALSHSLNSSKFRGMIANILCHASSTWTTRHGLRGSVLKGARCICPYAAAELFALPLGLATHAEAPSPTSTRTTPRTCPDSPWHRAQVGVHLDNEQMSFNRTGQLQRPRLTWMASVVCRSWSLTSCCAHHCCHGTSHGGTKIKHIHSTQPADTRQHTSVQGQNGQGQHGERWRTRPLISPSYSSHANCRNNQCSLGTPRTC